MHEDIMFNLKTTGNYCQITIKIPWPKVSKIFAKFQPMAQSIYDEMLKREKQQKVAEEQKKLFLLKRKHARIEILKMIRNKRYRCYTNKKPPFNDIEYIRLKEYYTVCYMKHYHKRVKKMRNQRIYRMYKEGEKVVSIAEKYGISCTAIYKILQEKGGAIKIKNPNNTALHL